MSQHWDPRSDLARARRGSWPAGATAGLALVAALCTGVVVTLYLVAGPNDVFEKDSGADWHKPPPPPPVEQ